MSAGLVRPTVRVTVVGTAGRADLVVPLGADVGSLSQAYAEAVGVPAPPSLTTVDGAPLAEHLPVDDAGLGDGDLVLAGDAPPVATEVRAQPGGRRDRDTAGSTRTRGGARLAVTGLAAGCGLAGAAVLAASGATGAVRGASVAVLLVSAVLCALPVGTGRDTVPARHRAAAGPVLGAAAGFAATYRDAPGGLLLALAVAALLAAVLAAMSRMFLDPDDDGLALVWLVASGSFAVVVTVLLLTGASPHGLWALAFAVAVVTARLLPYTVVDVPDRALLDLDRLAVTAWSARERPRAGRRRAMVRYDGVTRLVRRGRDLVAAGTLLVVALAAVTGPLLVLPGAHDVRGWASVATVALGAAALGLVARSFRAVLPRTALRICSAALFAAAGLALLRAGDGRALWAGFAAAAVLAGAAALTAVQLGRGWRSVWWARAADVAEGLSIVLVVALLPLSSGFFHVIAGFVA